jgi:hypothetical protein
MSRLLMTRAVWLCLAACALKDAPVSAQQPRGPQGDTYASIAALPDWSGIWVWPFGAFAEENERWRDPDAKGSPRLSPKAVAIRQVRVKQLEVGQLSSGQPPRAGTCSATPDGMPSVMRFPFGVEFLFTPGRVTILLETGSTMRRIHTDGRRHDVDAEPTRAGDSIGHWDGDTLVVETTAITPGNALIQGVPTTAGTRIAERLRKLDASHLQIDTVVDDPEMLLEPLRVSRVYERSEFGWFDRTCTNDRDGGDQEPDLTPPQ